MLPRSFTAAILIYAFSLFGSAFGQAGTLTNSRQFKVGISSCEIPQIYYLGNVFSFRLSNPPTATVSMNVAGNVQMTASPSVLSFSPSNYTTPRNVTITIKTLTVNSYQMTVTNQISIGTGRYNVTMFVQVANCQVGANKGLPFTIRR